jgi:predicted methyltransferase
VRHADAITLIRAAVTPGGVWADLGAGSGTFTRALASLLGAGGVVYAVDRDASALRDIERAPQQDRSGAADIRTIVADFTADFELPDLDGVVIANALHFVPYARQAAVLARVAAAAKSGAPIIVIEYDRRASNPWVPYPVNKDAFSALAHSAELGEPTLLATRPSRFSGSIYSVVVRRPGEHRR